MIDELREHLQRRERDDSKARSRDAEFGIGMRAHAAQARAAARDEVVHALAVVQVLEVMIVAGEVDLHAVLAEDRQEPLFHHLVLAVEAT